MSGSLYLFRELLRSLSPGSGLLAALAVGGIALALLLIALASLVLEPRSLPPQEGLIAVPLGSLSQAELAEVHTRLLEDPDIAGVRFVFLKREGTSGQTAAPGSPKGGEGSRGLGAYRIALRRGASAEAVIARLVGWGVFERVEEPQPEPPGLVRAWVEGPPGRWLLLGGLLLGVAVALGLLGLSLRAAQRSFRAERELLELSGVDPAVIRRPFALLGGLYAALGALLAALLAAGGGRGLVPAPGSELARALPELLEPGAFTQLGVRALLLGVVFVALGAGLGHLVARSYKYPSPRSRSRTSSSSAGESGDGGGGGDGTDSEGGKPSRPDPEAPTPA